MARKRAHHGSDWSAADDRRLGILRGRDIPAEAIAKSLGRSTAAIYQRLTTQKAKRKRARR